MVLNSGVYYFNLMDSYGASGMALMMVAISEVNFFKYNDLENTEIDYFIEFCKKRLQILNYTGFIKPLHQAQVKTLSFSKRY